MPGITGVDIKAINRFGLLKEATITYNCWDVSQLQELEMLFMRPGFSVLLEWGHSVYYTTDKNFVTIPQTITSFLTKGTTKEQLYEEIDTLKEKSGYNYDAIYGFIKNFSWSFRADGGYDCVTTLTSIGEIIESLQIDIDNPLPQGATAEESSAKSEEFIEAKKNEAKIREENPDKLADKTTSEEYIVIGDSQTGYIAYYSEKFNMIGEKESEANLHKTGENLKWLVKYVGVYPPSETVKGVAISIGTNGGFNDSTEDIIKLKAALERAFPNAATNLIVVKGSWGWGYNTAKNKVTKESAEKYYKKFADAGFTVSPTAIGDMSKLLAKKPAAPHDISLAIYKWIGSEIDGLLKK
jgi:hypothetical protein